MIKPCIKLEQIEQKNEWLQAKQFVYDNWRKDSNDLDKLVRVGTECWYVLTFWERLENTQNLDRTDFSTPLTEVKKYGFEHFADSDTFLWIFGYLIRLFPYWFSDFNGDLASWEKAGQDMIAQAYQINPENLIAKMLSLPEESEAYKSTCKMLEKSLNEYFSGKSAIEVYFKKVLSRNPARFHN